jgi:arylsulfatase A-like enzyme
MRRFIDRLPRNAIASALSVLLALAVWCAPSGCRSRKRQARPNVVLVVIDTLRQDHLPFYCYRVDTAPFLTGLAGQGVVFENCYSTSSFTSPATASILTSLYPFQHGVLKGMIVTLNQQAENAALRLNRIPEAALTLGEWLRANGYRTYAVADNINICAAEGFSQGFDRFVTLNNRGAEQVNRQAMLWEKEMRAGAPYFLYLHYMDPHAPYLAHAPWYVRGADELQDQVAKYDSEIRSVDEQLRAIFADLAWDEDTIVIVCADHGEEFLEHGQTGHGKTLYNEVLRVPLLIWSRALGLEPRRMPQAVSTLDIMPTVGALLGLKARQGFSGVSLWPLPAPGGSAAPRPLFAQLLASRPGGADSALRATMWDGWKFIVTDELFRELYDTRRYPRERLNQFGRSETAELANKLNGLFLSFKTRAPVFPQGFNEKKIDPKLLEELKTLGYVQ